MVQCLSARAILLRLSRQAIPWLPTILRPIILQLAIRLAMLRQAIPQLATLRFTPLRLAITQPAILYLIILRLVVSHGDYARPLLRTYI